MRDSTKLWLALLVMLVIVLLNRASYGGGDARDDSAPINTAAVPAPAATLSPGADGAGGIPPAVVRALELPASAVLREPPPPEAMNRIVCGEVSLNGKRDDYRRFVYSGVSQTSAYDDGTDVFRRFADKVCRMRR